MQREFPHMAFFDTARWTARGVLLAGMLWAGASSPTAAQRLTIGVVGGVNVTDDVKSGTETYPGGILPSGETQSTTFVVHPGERRPILGLSFEARGPRGWALEFEALHRELKSTTSATVTPPFVLPDGSVTSSFGTSRRTLTTWEFPLLVKRRFASPPLHPFAAIGPSFRPAGTGTGLSHVGVSAAAGIEIWAGGFRVAPQLRYTRWSALPVGFIVGSPRRNQLEVLVVVDRPDADSPLSLLGRRLSLGLIGGIGLGSDFRVGTFNPSVNSEGNSPILGVMLEAPLTRRWAVEVDGMYRPLHGSNLEFNRRVRFAHLTWEFPVLAKYRFPAILGLTPLVTAGPSFRAEGNLNLQSVSHFGVTVGAGVERGWRVLRVAPSIRYTRWGGADNPRLSQTRPNEFQLLVSLAF